MYITTPEQKNVIYKSITKILTTEIIFQYQYHHQTYGRYQKINRLMETIWIKIIMKLVTVIYLKVWVLSSTITEKKRKHTNTYYSVTECMLCVIPHISKYVFEDPDGNDMKQVKILSKHCFMDYQVMIWITLFKGFVASILISIKIMVQLMVMISYV